MHEPVRVVDALGVARDLGADHARGVAVVLGTMHPAYSAIGEQLDVERAGRGAVVRADRMADLDLGVGVHLDLPTLIAICPTLAEFARRWEGSSASFPQARSASAGIQ